MKKCSFFYLSSLDSSILFFTHLIYFIKDYKKWTVYKKNVLTEHFHQSIGFELFFEDKERQISGNERNQKRQSKKLEALSNSEDIERSEAYHSQKIGHNFHDIAGKRVDIYGYDN